MHIVIRASLLQKQELLKKGFSSHIIVEWLGPDVKFSQNKADTFFDLLFNDIDITKNEFVADKPVFVHAVNCTCSDINKPNYIRINAWPGFIERPVIELASNDLKYKASAENILKVLNWQYIWVKDDYGFVAARIIAMIINEAYFALEEKVSSRNEIDTAMKLGTNYPYGPFEWSKKIGTKAIYGLLKQMFLKDGRYTICRLLQNES